MANNLTLTSAAFDTSAGRFGAALSAGYGATAGNVFPASGPISVEAWFKASSKPASVAVVCGSASLGWIGYNGTTFLANISDGSSTGLAMPYSGTNWYDGNWHHVAIIADPSDTTAGTKFFFDGALVASSAGIAPRNYTTAFAVRDFGGDPTGQHYVWPGEVDEVAIWNTARYTAAFTPPTTALAGSETGLVALYHLDGNGNDSAVVPGTAIAPNSAGLTYSPANWLVTASAAKTINTGAYFKTIFSGASVALNFDLTNDLTPYTLVWVNIDGQGWQQFPLAARITPAMPAATAGWPKHMLEFVVRSMTETQNRWNAPQNTAVVFTGLTLAASQTVQARARRGKSIWFFGDSITEGTRTIAVTDPALNGGDALQTWDWRLGDMLGAEVGIVGFGASGLAVTGAGNVPPLIQSYPSLWAGQARDFTSAPPDLVVLMEGTNDSGAGVGAATFQAAYQTVLTAMLASLPNARFAVLRTFGDYLWAPTQAAVAAVKSPRVTLVDTAGFFDLTLSGDQLHPYGVADAMIADRLAPLLRPLLYPAAASGPAWTYL